MAGPAWGYKASGKGVEARLFEDGKLPRGWKDTPAALTPKKSAEKPHDDS